MGGAWAYTRVGSSKRLKHRRGLLDEKQWDIMIRDVKGRQRVAEEQAKEICQQRKRRLEKAAEAAEAKLREKQRRRQRSQRRRRIENGSQYSTE